MANSKITLYYFDGKGKAEAARIVLHAAGKEFTDIQFSEEEWPKYKHLAPFGQAPFLEIDGVRYSQSLAIKNYLAREFGFYGKTNKEALKIDEVNQLVEDLTTIAIPVLFNGTEDEIKVAVEKTKKEVSPKFLAFLEKLLKENGTGYFSGDSITLADIIVYDVATGMLEKVVDINSSYPLIQKNLELVKSHSKIGPYVTSRSATAF
uniref:Glutathione transferase n=1 Tax=Arion vulgaris TaxID=1028688 RepID=A0A0B7BF43_9EUPU